MPECCKLLLLILGTKKMLYTHTQFNGPGHSSQGNLLQIYPTIVFWSTTTERGRDDEEDELLLLCNILQNASVVYVLLAGLG